MARAKSMRKNVPAPADNDTESVLPLTDFRDTPFPGSDHEFSFHAGVPSPPVPADFAERMRKAGKAAPK